MALSGGGESCRLLVACCPHANVHESATGALGGALGKRQAPALDMNFLATAPAATWTVPSAMLISNFKCATLAVAIVTRLLSVWQRSCPLNLAQSQGRRHKIKQCDYVTSSETTGRSALDTVWAHQSNELDWSWRKAQKAARQLRRLPLEGQFGMTQTSASIHYQSAHLDSLTRRPQLSQSFGVEK